jgi:AcrR family transcriptional regulator
MKTKNRIINCALQLFNQNGERNTTTNHIAAHLEISPGNLYYHFHNKEEIIHSIFDQYTVDLKVHFPAIDNSSAANSLPTYHIMQNYLDSIFSLMWNYRFLYSNLPNILSRDKALQQKYLKAQQELHDNLVGIMFSFRDTGLVNLEDEEVVALTKTLHLVSTCWISYQTTMSVGTVITEKDIYRGMLQMLNVVKPIATVDGKKQFLALEQYYLEQCK